MKTPINIFMKNSITVFGPNEDLPSPTEAVRENNGVIAETIPNFMPDQLPPEVNDVEVMYAGTWDEVGDEIHIDYVEHDENGKEATKTRIAFHKGTPDVVHMLHTGFFRSGMMFEKGKNMICFHGTPFLQNDMLLTTYDVQNTLLLDGHLYLDYVLAFAENLHQRCIMDITIKEVK